MDTGKGKGLIISLAERTGEETTDKLVFTRM